MTTKINWKPPGKNCGMCGAKSCAELVRLVQEGKKDPGECPFYSSDQGGICEVKHDYGTKDVLGAEFDFVLESLPGEKSSRKIVLPFRGDLVEKMGIKKGDIVLGRPMGQGCPLQHVIEVIDADPISGVITGWVVGPKFARDRAAASIKDVKAYHVIAFEGIARKVKRDPIFGLRQRFLPGYCMMGLGHTAVVNTVLKRDDGKIFVHLEDIRVGVACSP